MATTRTERKRVTRPTRTARGAAATRLLASETEDANAIVERTPRGASPGLVYGHLQDLIVRGHLAPSSPVVETEIAGRLRLSRTPVRVALQRLHRQGFVVNTTGTRLFKFVVAPQPREDALALYHIVAEYDGLSARYAAGLALQKGRQLARALAR